MPEPVDHRHLLLIGAGPGVGASIVRRSSGSSGDDLAELRGRTVAGVGHELDARVLHGVSSPQT